jgi:hypothetical protein
MGVDWAYGTNSVYIPTSTGLRGLLLLILRLDFNEATPTGGLKRRRQNAGRNSVRRLADGTDGYSDTTSGRLRTIGNE